LQIARKMLVLLCALAVLRVQGDNGAPACSGSCAASAAGTEGETYCELQMHGGTFEVDNETFPIHNWSDLLSALLNDANNNGRLLDSHAGGEGSGNGDDGKAIRYLIHNAFTQISCADNCTTIEEIFEPMGPQGNSVRRQVGVDYAACVYQFPTHEHSDTHQHIIPADDDEDGLVIAGIVLGALGAVGVLYIVGTRVYRECTGSKNKFFFAQHDEGSISLAPMSVIGTPSSSML
jgi:hypothetical protein